MDDTPIRMDGDLIVDAVADACPRILTDEAAREIAEKTLLILSGMPGVVVTRGPDDTPWPPAREPAKPAEPVTGAPADPWATHERPAVPPQAPPWEPQAFRWAG